MSESSEGEGRKSIKKKIARITGSAIAGAALALGADQGAQSVSAADNTPTPDALGTQIAGAKSTLTAETTQTERERQLRDLNKQLTAVVDRRNATVTPRPNTVTPRPTPEPSATRIPPAVATANTEARRVDALGKRQAEIIATATRDAALTATVETRAAATSQAKQATAVSISREQERNRSQGGSPPGILGFLATLGLGVGAAVGVINRDRIRDAIPTPVRIRVGDVVDRVPIIRRLLRRNAAPPAPPAAGPAPTP